jgi:hypothetical protein
MNGIKRQLTTTYTPQKMVEMVRSMLQTKGLRNYFWVDAHLYIFSIDVPNVNHLRVFGCVVYVHVVDQKRQKLDPKSESCIFVGYSEQSKAYKLYNPLTNSIVVSRDMIFDEGGVYGHPKCHDDMSKSILDRDIIDDIDNEKTTNISVPSATNPPSIPSSNS